MPRVSSRIVFVTGGVMLVLGACRQIVGVDDRNPVRAVAPDAASTEDVLDTAPACSAPVDVAPACQSCLISSCCGETTACGGDVTCKRSFDCIARCDPSDAACAAACVQGFDAKLADALACRARSCAEPCAVSCGGIAGVVRPRHDGAKPECAKCLASKVCAETNACAQDSKCIQAAACPWRCALMDRACKSQCLFALGRQPLADAIPLGSCKAECGMGRDWTCVGNNSKYAFGKAPGNVALSFRLYSALDSTIPAVGVRVRGCFDAQCTAPVGTQCVSDDKGFCSGTVPLTNPGPVFHGYAEVSGAGILTTLYFMHPTVSGPFAGDASYCPTEAAVLTADNLALGMAVAGVSAVADRGHMIVGVFDCMWAGADDLIIDVSNADADTKVVYSASGLPSREAKATDETGNAFIFNVPVGPESLTITGRRASTGQIVAQSSVFVRKGAVTSLLLGPK